MSNLDYSINEAIKPTKKFINEMSKHFEVVNFRKGTSVIETTQRVNKYRNRIVRLQVNTNLNNFTEVIYAARYAVRSKRVELQTYRLTKSYVDNSNPKEKIDCEIVNITTVFHDNTDYKVTNFQISGLGYYRTIYIEEQDHNYLFRNSHLKYLKKHIPVLGTYTMTKCSETLIRLSKYKERFEILNNMKAYKVLRQALGRAIPINTISQKALKRDKQWFKQGLNPKQIKELDFIKKFYTLNPKNIELIANDYISKEGINNVLSYEKDLKIQKRKLLRYLDKQERSLNYYKDYISMCYELNIDVNFWMNRFPKCLLDAHDSCVKLINEKDLPTKKAEIKDINDKYIKKLSDLSVLDVFSNKYSLVLPKDLIEIYVEGKSLNHCVFSDTYLQRHAVTSLIMFVRETDHIDEPFFTLELNKAGEIVQLHGFGNENNSEKGQIAKKLLPEVRDFVDYVINDSNFIKEYSNVIEKIFHQ